MAQIRLFIKGMHCPSCPILLEESLTQISGIYTSKANLRTSICEIEYDETIFKVEKLIIEINKNINLLKFKAITEEEAKKLSKKEIFKSKNYWLEVVGGALVALFLWFLMEQLGLVAGMEEAEGWLMPLSVGFAASLSSCLALTGSVIIAFASRLGLQKKSHLILMNSSLQSGRLLSFFILGGVLGIIGGGIYISGSMLALTYIIIGVFLVLLGLTMLEINVTRFVSLPMPSSFNILKKLSQSKKKAGLLSPFIAGFMTIFLPCGFALSMMLVALQSNSFISGGLTMLLFAVGTLPVLFLVGFTASLSGQQGFGVLKKAMAFLIIAFAVQTFSTATYLFNINDNMLGLFAVKSAYAEERPKQIVESTITSKAFVPKVIDIKAGHEITWNITGDKISRCTNRIVVPDLDINLPIKNGMNTITFIAPDTIGRIKYSCWMAMVFGTLNVVE